MPVRIKKHLIYVICLATPDRWIYGICSWSGHCQHPSEKNAPSTAPWPLDLAASGVGQVFTAVAKVRPKKPWMSQKTMLCSRVQQNCTIRIINAYWNSNSLMVKKALKQAFMFTNRAYVCGISKCHVQGKCQAKGISKAITVTVLFNLLYWFG